MGMFWREETMPPRAHEHRELVVHVLREEAEEDDEALPESLAVEDGESCPHLVPSESRTENAAAR